MDSHRLCLLNLMAGLLKVGVAKKKVNIQQCRWKGELEGLLSLGFEVSHQGGRKHSRSGLLQHVPLFQTKTILQYPSFLMILLSLHKKLMLCATK